MHSRESGYFRHGHLDEDHGGHQGPDGFQEASEEEEGGGGEGEDREGEEEEPVEEARLQTQVKDAMIGIYSMVNCWGKSIEYYQLITQ